MSRDTSMAVTGKGMPLDGSQACGSHPVMHRAVPSGIIWPKTSVSLLRNPALNPEPFLLLIFLAK